LFRFTIRELVLVTVIVAMGLGWWVERRNMKRRFTAVRAWVGISCDADKYPIELFEDVPAAKYKSLRVFKSP
jgi:hypothetical protein